MKKKDGMETQFEVRTFDSHLSPEAFQSIPRFPVSVVLDNLRSAFNVGSIIRTADCALTDTIYCCGITAHPPHKKLEKTSLGALSYIQVEHRPSAYQAALEIKEKGIPIIALETTNQSRLIWKFNFPLPSALVLGNEALGVSQEVLEIADSIVEIPMLGFKNSINVAVAFGIVVHEIQRQHWQTLSKKSLVHWNTKP